MKKFVILSCLLFASVAHAQVALSYYPLSSYVGVSSNPNRIFWTDLRLLTNTFISNSNMELLPMINVKRDSIVIIYVGAGMNFNILYGLYGGQYINSYCVQFGTRVSPFRRARNFSFIAEVAPHVNHTFVGATINTNVGVAWWFARQGK